MAPICALKTTLYKAVQRVLGGGLAAPVASDFDELMKALEVLRFTQTNVPGTSVVRLNAPVGWNAHAHPLEVTCPLEVTRPGEGSVWYSFEYTSMTHALEERYGVSENSFIEFPEALLPGVDGYLIREGEGF